ncbi:hypothetical protein SAVIM40S_03157 [Streptomyces avidinii]|uniref:Transposase n=1 Tax=Streptomyces avidinii TaxID=1895 RepID=A0ABS4LFU3_STRAV|nr:transposase [Streptomyces avidinii]
MIDAVAFKYRTGTPWMDLPEHFGSWKGAHNRLRMWAADGTREKGFTSLLAQAEGDLDRVVVVDSTIVRAQQHAAGARQKGAPAGEPPDHALGRSRGGPTTKIHLAADGRCRPPAFDREAYKQRNTVERCINKLKQWRGPATRYDKTATIYLAGLHLAASSSGQPGDPKDTPWSPLPRLWRSKNWTSRISDRAIRSRCSQGSGARASTRTRSRETNTMFPE